MDSPLKRTVLVEAIAVMPTTLSHCKGCRGIFKGAGVEKEVNRELISEYPREFMDEFLEFSKIIEDLRDEYGNSITIQLIDAQSPAGIYKSLIHRFRKYPTFVVNKKSVYTGTDRTQLGKIIEHEQTR